MCVVYRGGGEIYGGELTVCSCLSVLSPSVLETSQHN